MMMSTIALSLALTMSVPQAGLSGQDKWRSARYGLFVHHVYGGGLTNMTPLSGKGGFPQNLDEFANAFNVERFANSVEAMGFEYVIFTAWHFNMNVLYPSSRMSKWRGPGHATTKRDLLGEIISALKKKNISVALYSHTFVGHEFRPDSSRKYYAYDNKEGPVTDEMRTTGYYPAASVPWGPQPPPKEANTWNDFINDIYDEMAARYGSKVDAMYFDGSWVWMVDRERLFATIRKRNPKAALIANGPKEHGYPFASKEVGSPSGKDYGFAPEFAQVKDDDSRTWPGYKRHVALIAGANWWAAWPGGPKFSPEQIARYSILQAATSEAGGIGWSFGTYADGSFETGLEDCFKKAWKILKPIEKSFRGVAPSKAYPVREHQTISTLLKGFVATESLDGAQTFVHVLNPPKTKVLELPPAENGIEFKEFKILGQDKALPFDRLPNGYRIVIGQDWDNIDTVIVCLR